MPEQTNIAVPLLAPSPKGDAGSKDTPYVLSYFAQRRAAGYIGLALPVIVVFFDRFISRYHCVPDSISASYYTGARNFFVGSLCAVGIFLISSVGYRRDIKYSVFAGVMSFLVAFDPCGAPAAGVPFCGLRVDLPYPYSGTVHFVSAILLFLTFAFFCLVLFTRSTDDPDSFAPRLKGLPEKKKQRNVVFIVCGCIMLAAMGCFVIAKIMDPELRHHQLLIVEWVCLWAFGIAWLVKGQQLLKDTVPDAPMSSVEAPPRNEVRRSGQLRTGGSTTQQP